MRVRIDQIDCTGSGMCEFSVPEVFRIDEAGLAVVRTDGVVFDAGVTAGGVGVPAELQAAVREAAAGCPGACIVCSDS